MALFLTGMINDGARTAANGPGETRLYQTATEGAVGGGEGRGEGVVGADRGAGESTGSEPTSPPHAPHPLLAKDLTAQVPLSKAPARGGRQPIGREFTGRDLCLESGRTYLRTEVLNCPSWGPAPRRWLWVQTWPSLLWYRRCNSAANRAGSGLVGSPAQA